MSSVNEPASQCLPISIIQTSSGRSSLKIWCNLKATAFSKYITGTHMYTIMEIPQRLVWKNCGTGCLSIISAKVGTWFTVLQQTTRMTSSSITQKQVIRAVVGSWFERRSFALTQSFRQWKEEIFTPLPALNWKRLPLIRGDWASLSNRRRALVILFSFGAQANQKHQRKGLAYY